MMVLDYSERKPVSRNKPKKKPFNFFAVTLIGAVLISFAGGVLTGWLIFRNRVPATPPVAVQPAQNAANASPEAGKTSPAAVPGGQVPLTFYENLSKGNQALIGSGFNPKKGEGEVPARQPAPQSQPVAPQKPAVNSASPPKEEKKVHAASVPASQTPAKEGAKKPAGTAVAYTVQIASYKDRKEAEVMVARIIGKGLAAYVSESNVPGKGVWYRVRIGKRLSREAAADLAARSGKGAQLIPE